MERQLTQVGACFHEKSGFERLNGYAVPCGERQQAQIGRPLAR
jgi:hypothetical protein